MLAMENTEGEYTVYEGKAGLIPNEYSELTVYDTQELYHKHLFSEQTVLAMEEEAKGFEKLSYWWYKLEMYRLLIG